MDGPCQWPLDDGRGIRGGAQFQTPRRRLIPALRPVPFVRLVALEGGRRLCKMQTRAKSRATDVAL